MYVIIDGLVLANPAMVSWLSALRQNIEKEHIEKYASFLCTMLNFLWILPQSLTKKGQKL